MSNTREKRGSNPNNRGTTKQTHKHRNPHNNPNQNTAIVYTLQPDDCHPERIVGQARGTGATRL
jgi:hypothetical protein